MSDGDGIGARMTQVPTFLLSGQPHTSRVPDHAEIRRGVQGVRRALLDPTGPSRSADEVTAVVEALPALMNSMQSGPAGTVDPRCFAVDAAERYCGIIETKSCTGRRRCLRRRVLLA